MSAESDAQKVQPSWVLARCGHPAMSVMTSSGYTSHLPCAICEVKRLMRIVEAAQAIDSAWDEETGAVVAGKSLLALRKSLENYEEDKANE